MKPSVSEIMAVMPSSTIFSVEGTFRKRGCMPFQLQLRTVNFQKLSKDISFRKQNPYLRDTGTSSSWFASGVCKHGAKYWDGNRIMRTMKSFLCYGFASKRFIYSILNIYTVYLTCRHCQAINCFSLHTSLVVAK